MGGDHMRLDPQQIISHDVVLDVVKPCLLSVWSHWETRYLHCVIRARRMFLFLGFLLLAIDLQQYQSSEALGHKCMPLWLPMALLVF
jgi:hypothetical protein